MKLQRYRLTSDDAVFFIRQLKSLQHFEFGVKEQSEYNRVLA